jgi:hypothetical protein
MARGLSKVWGRMRRVGGTSTAPVALERAEAVPTVSDCNRGATRSQGGGECAVTVPPAAAITRSCHARCSAQRQHSCEGTRLHPHTNGLVPRQRGKTAQQEPDQIWGLSFSRRQLAELHARLACHSVTDSSLCLVVSQRHKLSL